MNSRTTKTEDEKEIPAPFLKGGIQVQNCQVQIMSLKDN